MSRRFLPCQAPGQEAIAPSAMLLAGSGTSDASVTWWICPWPWHSGQAPATVFGENESESRRCGLLFPARDMSIRSELEIRLSVPTVERADGLVRRWVRATAGGRPVISSTSGTGSWASSRRA